MLINTSFNIRGEPIVCAPPEAYRCFLATNMDALVMGHYLLLKSQQPDATRHEMDQYLAELPTRLARPVGPGSEVEAGLPRPALRYGLHLA